MIERYVESIFAILAVIKVLDKFLRLRFATTDTGWEGHRWSTPMVCSQVSAS